MVSGLLAAVSYGKTTATVAVFAAAAGPSLIPDHALRATGTASLCQDSASTRCAHLWPRVGNLGREHSGSTAPMQLGRKSTRPKRSSFHWMLSQLSLS